MAICPINVITIDPFSFVRIPPTGTNVGLEPSKTARRRGHYKAGN